MSRSRFGVYGTITFFNVNFFSSRADHLSLPTLYRPLEKDLEICTLKKERDALSFIQRVSSPIEDHSNQLFCVVTKGSVGTIQGYKASLASEKRALKKGLAYPTRLEKVTQASEPKNAICCQDGDIEMINVLQLEK